jgi:pyruvate/2-oxoglutarate dehydrogenase complex dihydrolipoamide dehydrogenase (E3) component
VLGGGPVGVEIAQMLAGYGAAVALADTAARPLDGEAPEVGDLLARRLRRGGVELAMGREATRAVRDADGVAVTFDDGSRLTAERLVVATGRRPRVEGIGLDTVGIAPRDGAIAVDERCRAAEGVWAVGDVTGVAQFTHLAAYQGRVACADILGEPVAADYSAIPRSVFCDPEVAAVGMTERQAREAGIDVATATVDLGDLERTSTYGRDIEGLIGVVADRRAAVLVGAHAVGPLASEWIHLAVLAVRARVPVNVLGDLIAQFPSFSEGLVAAARALEL